MLCDECVELGSRCPVCQEVYIGDIQRRVDSKIKWKRSYVKQMTQLPLCLCCNKQALALVYHNCPEGMYVGHKVSKAEGGKHCARNLMYYVKTLRRG